MLLLGYFYVCQPRAATEGVIPVKELGDIYKENPRSIVFARYAEELVREGKIERAVEILKKGIEYHPHYAPGHSVLATMYLMQDLPAEATKELEQSINLDPQMPSDLFRLGEYYLKEELAVKAVACLWAAYRFETENGELAETYEKAEELRLTKQDLRLDEQSERALSELTVDKKPLAETIVAAPSTAKKVSDAGAEVADEGDEMAEAATAPGVLPELDDEAFEPSAVAPEDTESISDAAFETGDMSEDVSDLMKMAFGDEETQFAAGDETVTMPDDRAEAIEEEMPVDEDIVSDIGIEIIETEVMSDIEIETEAGTEAETVSLDDDLTAYLKNEYSPGKMTAEPSAKLTETAELPDEPEHVVDPGGVTDEEFDALIDAGAPDISDLMTGDDVEAGEKDIEPLPVNDSAFELDLTEHIDSFQDRQGDEEPSLKTGDVDFDQLIEQGAPDIGPIDDQLLELESEDESYTGDASAETGEEDYAGSIVVDQEDVSFEEEVAGIRTDDDREGPIEPVSSGSGDQPEAIGVHEIEDDAAYNPVEFAFGTASGEDDEPVLTDEERRELMAFETIEDTDLTSTGSYPAVDTEDNLPGLDEESSPTVSVTEDEDGIFTSELTREEIDVLSVTGTEADEPDGSLEAEMRDGIDYSDVLPGEKSGLDIEDSLDEAVVEDFQEPDSSSKEREFDFDVLDADTDIEMETETETDADAVVTGVSGFEIDDEIVADDSLEAAMLELEPEGDEMSVSDDEAVDTEESADDSLRFVEDMIKSAPGIEIETGMDDEPDEPEENNQTLDDLITQYEQSINDSGASSGESRKVSREPSPPVDDIDLMLDENNDDVVSDTDNSVDDGDSGVDASDGVLAEDDLETDAVADEAAEEDFDINLDDDGGVDLRLTMDDGEGDVTPTMAEIYVAQGLFEQAIRMYETIIRKQPENDRARSRLRELRGLYGQEAGGA